MKEIKGTTGLCALLGNPTGHSLSPLIHNNFAYMTYTDMAYITFEPEKDALGDAVKGAFALGIKGLNVTVPYKEDVIKHLSGTDPIAKAIGAVNTLVRKEDGYYGYNTDILGFVRELKKNDFSLCGANVVILGAGGVARAIAFACVNEGAFKTFILNRSVEKAQKIKKDILEYFGEDAKGRIEARPLDDSELLDIENILLVQTTNVGMYPNSEDILLKESVLYDKAVFGFDVIYNPYETAFIRKLKQRGKRAVNGLPMLLYQAEEAFKMWFNVEITNSMEYVLYSKLRDALGIHKNKNAKIFDQNKDNIILVGFMGSGKTTLGKWIAKHTGRTLIDTDREIETMTGLTIKEIFDTKGEDYFRKLETDYLENLVKEKKTGLVISVGGGTPVAEKNRELLKNVGTVVYLRASAGELMKRLRYDVRRPLLQGKDGKERRILIEDMLKKREPAYMSAANIVVRTDGVYFPNIYQIIHKKIRGSNISGRKKNYPKNNFKQKRRQRYEDSGNKRPQS